MTEMQTPTTRVLSIGSDSMLLSIREMLLEQAGYTVCSLSERSVSPETKIASFELLLLCHTIPFKRAESIGAWIKSRVPHIAVIRLASLYSDCNPLFDAVCNVQNGPLPMLKELASLSNLIKAAAA